MKLKKNSFHQRTPKNNPVTCSPLEVNTPETNPKTRRLGDKNSKENIRIASIRNFFEEDRKENYQIDSNLKKQFTNIDEFPRGPELNKKL